MDQPIGYRPWPVQQLLKTPPYFVDDKFHNAFVLDDKDTFLTLIKNPEPGQCFDYEKDLYLANLTINPILSQDALQIALAFLTCETGDDVVDGQLEFKNGWTPLHLACATPSPKFLKYFIERGYPVDAPCDYKPLNLKHATPLDLALEVIDHGYEYGYYPVLRPWTLRRSIFELFHYVCEGQKPCLEVIRVLIQNTQNKERLRKAFIDSANEGKFVKVVALYLAAPELFLSKSVGGGNMSSIDELYRDLNSSEKTTDIQHGLSLLLDVFDLVGQMLIGYLRVIDPRIWDVSNEKKTSFFLREAAHKKLGISSRDDYLLSLFKPVSQDAIDPLSSIPRPKSNFRGKIFLSNKWQIFPFRIKTKHRDMDFVNRAIPNLKPPEADGFRRVIDNKLSKMPNIRALFENTTRTPNEGREQRSSFPHPRSIVEPWMRSFHTEAANVEGRLDVRLFSRNGWKSRVMNPTKLSSFMSAVRLSGFHIIRRLVQ